MSKVVDLIISNSGWIIALITFFIPPIRDFVIKKFQSSLDKALEDKKSQNDRKNYISKTRFDAEFEIYRNLSKAFCKMENYIYNLIPIIGTEPKDPLEKEKYYNELYNRSTSAYIEAQDTLYENAPFIPIEKYKAYQEILNLCNQQLNMYSLFHDEKLPLEAYTRNTIIADKMEELNNNIRIYLNSLDVL